MSGLRYLAAELRHQRAHRVLRRRVAPRAAGVVYDRLAAGRGRALGHSELEQHVPDARALAEARLAERLPAGGAGRDDRGIAQALQLGAQLCAGLVEELLAPGPVGDDAAAAEQYAHAAVKPRAQIGISPVHRLRRDGPRLTAGEEHIFAALIARLRAAEEGLAV